MLQPSEAIQLFFAFFDSKLFVVLQVLGGLISLALLAAIIILIKKGGVFETHTRDLWTSWNATPIPKSRMVKRWLLVREAMGSEDPGRWRGAIIDADSMLDELVERLGYMGSNLEERLGNVIPGQFASLENAWRAHQVSNFLKEDSSYPLTREIVDKTIEIYESVFKETGIIL